MWWLPVQLVQLQCTASDLKLGSSCYTGAQCRQLGCRIMSCIQFATHPHLPCSSEWSGTATVSSPDASSSPHLRQAHMTV